jgi:hypothetical protein
VPQSFESIANQSQRFSMQGSNVIQTVPSAVSGAGAAKESRLARERRRKRTPSAISKVAWMPQGELAHSEWLATGRRLGAIGRCSQWWIGDWIRYGTAKWGEKYAEAARVTGYDVASLRNMAWVASRFNLSLRSDRLTWSHHVLLAPLEPDEQRHWLQRAAEERLSVADLRVELRALREGTGKPSVDAAATTPGDGDLVCPHCGHTLQSAVTQAGD